MPTQVLRSYRHAYKLDTPPTFNSFETELSLTNPEGLGKYSPSMARRKDKRKVNKETLALAVRKEFNAAAVTEADVITNFLYSVKNQSGSCPRIVPDRVLTLSRQAF
jgi:histone deacetylase complex subunit SAP30